MVFIPCFRNLESVIASIHGSFDAETVAAKLAAYTGLRRIPGPFVQYQYIQIVHTHKYPRSQGITANQHIGYNLNYSFGSPPPPPPLHLSSIHLLDLLQPLLRQLLHLPQPLEERWRGGGDPNK